MKNHPETCFECGEGHYFEIVEDYHVMLFNGEMLTVQKILILRCDSCGEDIIPPKSSRQIDDARLEYKKTFINKLDELKKFG